MTYHGWHDSAVPAMGTINYYSRAADVVGGYKELSEFNKLYMVPAYGHCFGIGSVAPSLGPTPNANNVPLPGPDQFFNTLGEWTEKGIVPASIELKSAEAVPLCLCARIHSKLYITDLAP